MISSYIPKAKRILLKLSTNRRLKVAEREYLDGLQALIEVMDKANKRISSDTNASVK